MTPLTRVWLSLASLILSACGGGILDEPPRLLELRISSEESSLNLQIGQTRQLQAIASYDNDTTRDLSKKVRWRSSDESIVAVDAQGNIKGLAAGGAEISAVLPDTNNRFRDKVKYSVSPRLQEIEIVAPTDELLEESTLRLQAIGHYNNDTVADISEVVSWTSDYPDIAIFEEGSLLRALRSGEVNVRASFEKRIAEYTINIGRVYERIELVIENNEFFIGDQFPVQVLAYRLDGLVLDITDKAEISVSNTDILANIDNNPSRFRAASQGETNITATYRGRVADRSIFVSRVLNLYVGESGDGNIALSWDHNVGETYTLNWGYTDDLGDSIAIADINSDNYVHQNIDTNRIYYYQLVSSTGNKTAITKVTPFDNTWDTAHNLLHGIMRPAMAMVGNNAYLAGGYYNSDTHQGTTNELIALPLPDRTINTYDAMPTAVRDASACAHNGIVYVFGGTDQNGVSTALQRFDTQSRQWLAPQSLNTPRALSACAVVGEDIYLIGGSNGNESLDMVEKYSTTNGNWTMLPPLPQTRQGLVSVTLNGNLYVLGGLQDDVSEDYRLGVLTWDAVNEIWLDVGALIEARAYAGATVYNNKIYLFGGKNTSGILKSAEVFDPTSGESTPLPDLPHPRYSLVVANNGDTAFLIGGGPFDTEQYISVDKFELSTHLWQSKPKLRDQETARFGFSSEVVSDTLFTFGGFKSGTGEFDVVTEAFDYHNNRWSTLASMQTPRARVSSAVLDGKIYAIGGSNPHLTTAFDTNESYIPELDQWQYHSPLPAKRRYSSACTLNGKIYLSGGEDENGNATDTFFEYDPSKDKWRELARLRSPRYEHQCIVLHGKIYIIGGIRRNSTGTEQVSASMDFYMPNTNSWSATTSMEFPRSAFRATVINNNIYIFGGFRLNSTGQIEETASIAVYSSEEKKWRDNILRETETAQLNFPFSIPRDLSAPQIRPHVHLIQQELLIVGGESDSTAISEFRIIK